MTVYRIDPLSDPRWTGFVERHPRASVFHTSGWLEALERTYGYEPTVFTTSAPGAELANAVVFCEIRSWLTGNRLVSLPFSDHCEPLLDDAGQLTEICNHLDAQRRGHGWRSIELRPQAMEPTAACGVSRSEAYWLHLLDLRADLNAEALLRSFHPDSIRRKIHRARRENLACDEGRSDFLLAAFYRLLVLTRRRQQLPPQPFEWFRNLAWCLGPAMKVRIASQSGRPIAGIVTLYRRGTMVYKYGASDAAFHACGGMQLLLWNAILEARELGCLTLDLGRSDLHQKGLIQFKDRWGASRCRISYWRRPGTEAVRGRPVSRVMMAASRRMLAHVPDGMAMAAGRLLYKHVG